MRKANKQVEMMVLTAPDAVAIQQNPSYMLIILIDELLRKRIANIKETPDQECY